MPVNYFDNPPVDTEKKVNYFDTITPPPEPISRNTLQEALGVFLDAPVKLASEAGMKLGELATTGIEKATGKEIFNQEQASSQGLRVPGFGTEVKPLKDVTGKQVTGQALSTAGLLTGNPMIGGALIGAGSALENDSGAAGTAISTIAGALGGKILQFGFKAAAPEVSKLIEKYGMPAYKEIASHIPDAFKDTYKLLAEKSTRALEKVQLPEKVSGTLGKFQELAGKAEQKISGTVTSAAEKLGIKKPVKTNTEKIQELITPKPTVKEAKLAEKQGRLVKGKEPTLLKSGTPDIVLPSEKTISATKSIEKNIPNAANMSEPELYTALEKKTTDTAKKLKPQMQKMGVQPKSVDEMNSSWEKLKVSQLEKADATEEANIKKLQSQFEARLKTIDNAKSMDDVWQARKDYDASVPENVKKANSLSSESLQNKKEIWLQNRDILNKVIEDLESKLGSKTRKAFAEMSDMYQAKENILSKAKIETKPQPSKLKQFTGKHPYITGGIITAAATATGIPKKAIEFISNP